MLLTEQTVLPKLEVFSVMLSSSLGWPFQKLKLQVALKAKVSLLGSAKLLVASAQGSWMRWSQHLVFPTPVWGVPTLPAWLT